MLCIAGMVVLAPFLGSFFRKKGSNLGLEGGLKK
jgi:hypothetical protein